LRLESQRLLVRMDAVRVAREVRAVVGRAVRDGDLVLVVPAGGIVRLRRVMADGGGAAVAISGRAL